MKSQLRFSLFTIFCLLLTSALRGEDAKTEAPAENKPAGKSAPKFTAEEIKQTVEQLKSGKYKERNEATDKLMIAGRDAVGPVAEAARTDDLELGARCVDILKNLYKNGDAQTKAEAEKALKALQQGKHEAVAKWAGEALEKPLPAFPNRNGIVIGGGGIIIRGGQRIQIAPARRRQFQREFKVTEKGRTYHITDTFGGVNGRQIAVKITEKVKGEEKTSEIKVRSVADLKNKHKDVYDIYRKNIGKAKLKIVAGNNAGPLPAGGRAAGGGGMRINTRIVNGRREMDIDDNGKKIQIADSNGKDIVMKVTETVNGKQKTTEYKAKDVAELKKKHADAAKMYENYTSRVRVRVNGGGFFRAGRGFGRVRQPRGFPGNANNAQARQQMEKARARLMEAVQKLSKFASQGNTDPKELKKLSAEVQSAQAELQKAMQNLLK